MITPTNAAIFQLIYTTYFFITHFIPMKPFGITILIWTNWILSLQEVLQRI
ncbi:hypothetical protein [Leptospira alexanderi]|uniref:Uncharacterized protein n=1 Tax=Leptospira alexanderi serovar Manhao 3 str. L 60 TaxID=1049759 RepID=V6I2L2_9LEPT|nr:hypothetical protein [Leptospira alexanderi]EQA64475.1 hypothetical protein LEP1GSC062_0371 [Leptospira alexanderi serovar Manhao 3 str. L 60]